MKQTRVQMRYCRGTKDLTFRVDSEDGRFYQQIHGDGYEWDGDTLTIIKRKKVQYHFPNAVLC